MALRPSSGIPEALPWVAGGFVRVMALSSVQALLPSWLRTTPPLR
ncbi:hypothetical protein ACIBO2_48690 [Nonomuraea sp. NPDC050022]